MAARIDTKTARDGLTARREPYWHQLRAGGHLGYRKVAQGEGSWIAKWRDPATGKREYNALGTIIDSGKPSAFEQARKLANQWFDKLDHGGSAKALTVQDAVDGYLAEIRRTDPVKADRTKADLRRVLDGDPLASINLDRLRPHHVEEWRDRMSSRKARIGRGDRVKDTPLSKGTLNRDMVPVRAALNRAYEHGEVTTDIAWRRALKPFSKAGGRRTLYLSRDERALLIEKAGDEIEPFLRALALLPLRPGALAALTVADYKAREQTLRIGVDKAHKERWIKLPTTTAALMAEQAKGKLPAAPLIGRASGERWNKNTWKKAIHAAVEAAELPKATSAYTLRHSVITDLVTGGLDLLTIAQISGTSVAMIEQHYGHLRQEHAAKALAALAL